MESIARIIKKETMKTSNWSGGTTTQILIYPETADYAKRDFLWRISTARVEVEESTFTSLPGISRILMILQGELEIHHEGHHDKFLEAYDTDTFLGEWVTKSYGKVIDFNLMMKAGVKGELDTLTINANTNCDYRLFNETSFENESISSRASFFYSPFNDIEIFIKEEKYLLCSGDMFYIEHKAENNLINFVNSKDKDISIVFGKIQY